MSRTWHPMYQQAFQSDGILWGENHAERELLRRRAARGDITKLYNNIYVLKEKWQAQDYKTCVQGLIRAVEHRTRSQKKVYCLITAAALWDLDIPYRLQNKNVLCVVNDRPTQRPSRIYRHVHIQQPRTVSMGEIVVTDLPQTLRDCAHHLPFPDALALIESALHKNLLHNHRQELRRLLREDAQFNAVFMHASAKSESVGESIAKATIIELGFEVPLQQVNFFYRLPDGKTREYRVDFLWPGESTYIAGEFDGVAKYYSGGDNIHSQVSHTISKERQRDNHLLQLGISHVVHFDYRLVMDREEFQHRLTEAGVPRVRRL